MKHRALTTATAFFALSVAACYVPPQIPVVGGPGELSQLVGMWNGEYSSPETGRSGTISFEMTAVGDTAHGHVVMTPRGGDTYRPADYEGIDPHFAAGDVLHVDFIQVGVGELRGELSPYRNPDCGCVLLTMFEGTIEGDVIRGVFTSTVADTGIATAGQWRVTRTRRNRLPNP